MITANSYFNSTLEAYKKAAIIPRMAKAVVPVDAGVDKTATPLVARVNQGRWIVDCPCGGAELAWDEGLFMCLSCFNSFNKHQYVRVVFPANRMAITAELEKRPLINRNWSTDETVEMLRLENKAHEEGLL